VAILAALFAGACSRGDERQAADAPSPQGTPNRLANEHSPYLQQHAHNPVAWYPWGSDAFEKARRESKPIFLSIGYSTCHWCHVMEEESFADPAVAAILNAHYVAIKVDREERPDLDGVYMAFVQASTGRGGWPLNVWLTPDLQPFYGGTYFPRQRIGGRPGFIEVLRTLHERWTTDRQNIETAAHQAVAALQAHAQLENRNADGVVLDAGILARAYETQARQYDAHNGGFGPAPKFPRPAELMFLHREFARTGNAEALRMAEHTLRSMAAGGIHDQLGGGFHRYSTDAFWLVPHFEKMLYDQAQIVIVGLELHQLTGDARFAEVVRRTLDYVQQRLIGEHGAFLSAEDADSALDPARPDDKIEGAFYVWRHAECQQLLGADLLALAELHFGLRPEGNIGGTELRGYNVLYEATPLGDAADSLGIALDEALRRRAEIQRILLRARDARPRPHLDDKVLTDWNGLAISAFARAGAVLQSAPDLAVATRAARFVIETLWDDGHQRLRHRYRQGHAGIDAFNADYAYLVQGLLDLYESSLDAQWLAWADKLTARQIELFGDPGNGGFFESSGADSTLIYRARDEYDGALPTSNAVTALNLLRLGDMLDSQTYRTQAQRVFTLYGATLASNATALPAMLVALDFELAERQQIILTGAPDAAETRALAAAVHARFLPHKVLLLADAGTQQALAGRATILDAIAGASDRATAFVCREYACQLPVTDAEALAKLLPAARLGTQRAQ
jgi:uncharacterized protein YyaL (SSP411 family)